MIISQKQALRRVMKERRFFLYQQYPHAGEALAQLFFEFFSFPPTTLVSTYWPIGEEIDTRPLTYQLSEKGFSCALPCVAENTLVFRMWAPSEPLVKGKYKILEPHPSLPPVTPEVILIPLLAFDREGRRLGYGQGHYDRYLDRHKALKIGVGFQEQEVDTLPKENHDISLDYVLTNGNVIPCSPS